MKARCSECKFPEPHVANKETRYWCPEKGIWIPWRKYKIKRRCGKFEAKKQRRSIAGQKKN